MPPTNSTRLDDIKRLGELRKSGAISEQEFLEQKTRLFGGAGTVPPVHQAAGNSGEQNTAEMQEAKKSINSGFCAAMFVTVVTSIIASIAMLSNSAVMGINAWAFLDAAIFGFFAWRIKMGSRVCAVLATLLFVAEKLAMLGQLSQNKGGIIFALLIIFMFCKGVQGTFALHKIKQSAPNIVTA